MGFGLRGVWVWVMVVVLGGCYGCGGGVGWVGKGISIIPVIVGLKSYVYIRYIDVHIYIGVIFLRFVGNEYKGIVGFFLNLRMRT